MIHNTPTNYITSHYIPHPLSTAFPSTAHLSSTARLAPSSLAWTSAHACRSRMR
jgi:hypothetical protein